MKTETGGEMRASETSHALTHAVWPPAHWKSPREHAHMYFTIPALKTSHAFLTTIESIPLFYAFRAEPQQDPLSPSIQATLHYRTL
jgi:hypothetical protein